MKLEDARKICHELLDMDIGELDQHFERFEVCGSIRREKAEVNDIDIVAILKTNYTFGEPTLSDTIRKLDPAGPKEAKESGKPASRFLDGPDIKRFFYKGIMIDIYLAKPEEFETLTLIRTGSLEHNIRLTTLAKGKGMRLYANGMGLWRVIPNPKDEKNPTPTELVSNTEEGILKVLLGKYVEPKDRGI